MLRFFNDKQKEEIIQKIAKELNLSPEEVRKDKELVKKYIKKKCKGEKEEIIKL